MELAVFIQKTFEQFLQEQFGHNAIWQTIGQIVTIELHWTGEIKRNFIARMFSRLCEDVIAAKAQTRGIGLPKQEAFENVKKRMLKQPQGMIRLDCEQIAKILRS